MNQNPVTSMILKKKCLKSNNQQSLIYLWESFSNYHNMLMILFKAMLSQGIEGSIITNFILISLDYYNLFLQCVTSKLELIEPTPSQEFIKLIQRTNHYLCELNTLSHHCSASFYQTRKIILLLTNMQRHLDCLYHITKITNDPNNIWIAPLVFSPSQKK